MKDDTKILWAVALKILIIAAFSSALLTAISMLAYPPKPPTPTSSSSALVKAPEPPPAPSASAAPVPKETLQVLQEIPAQASYKGAGCLSLKTRVAVQSWNLPYPHQVTITGARPLDCGFFPKVQPDGWRTAFCLRGNERVPTKLFLLVDGPTLSVTTGSEDFGSFTAGTCS
jgi:hypothetical protein